MAGSHSLALGALKAHLNKSTCNIPLNTSEELLKFLKDCYPTLDIQVARVEGHKERWLIVCCALYSHGGSLGSFKPARMAFHQECHFNFEVTKQVLCNGLLLWLFTLKNFFSWEIRIYL